MLQSGTLCFYKLERHTSILEKMIQQNQFRDQDNRLLTQRITCFDIGQVSTPRYDSMTYHSSKFHRMQTVRAAKGEANMRKRQKNTMRKADHSSTSSIETDSSMLETRDDDKWLILGMSRGQVIFFNLYNLEILHSRYDVVNSEVSMVRECIKLNLFLVLEKKGNLTLCEFKNNKVQVCHQVKTFRPMFDIAIHNDDLLLSFKSGDVELFKITNVEHQKHYRYSQVQRRVTGYRHNLTTTEIVKMQKDQGSDGRYRMVRIDVSKAFDHDDPLTSIYVDNCSGRFITSDSTGLVKIWTKDKQLINEITFHEKVKCVMFIDDNCDILVGHGKFISLMKVSGYNVKVKLFSLE